MDVYVMASGGESLRKARFGVFQDDDERCEAVTQCASGIGVVCDDAAGFVCQSRLSRQQQQRRVEKCNGLSVRIGFDGQYGGFFAQPAQYAHGRIVAIGEHKIEVQRGRG